MRQEKPAEFYKSLDITSIGQIMSKEYRWRVIDMAWRKDGFSPEIAINVSHWDKKSTWIEIVRKWQEHFEEEKEKRFYE